MYSNMVSKQTSGCVKCRAMLVFVLLWLLCRPGCSTEGSKFTSVPTTVKSFENDTILLPCYLDNIDPETRVKWWKGEELLADTHAPHHLLPERLRVKANRSLEIVRLQAADTGSYTCEVFRQDPWSSIKQVHAIEVQYAPVVRIIPEDGFVEVQKGEYVDIGCDVSGTPAPIINWSKNGEPMALLDHRSRIRFKAETRNLAGVYECIAVNGVGDPVKRSITVLIQDAPVVKVQRAWVHTTPGLRAVLEAELEFATPPATTKWFKGGVQVHSNDRIVMVVRDHIHQLVFRNVRESDLGNYTFRAENRLGMADVSFRLTGVPNVASFKVDASRNKATATSFTLLWEVDSYSVIVEYNLWLRPYVARVTTTEDSVVTEDTQHNRWRKIVVPAGDANDGPIHSASYVVSGLTPATVYEAFVTSRNSIGWSKPSTTLHFATEPGVRAQPSTSDYSELQTPLVLEDVPQEMYNNSLQNSYKKNPNGENSARRMTASTFSLCVMLLFVSYLLRLL